MIMATEGEDVAEIIERLSEQYSRSVNGGDTHWLVETFYARDAYFLAPGHDMARGSGQIRAVIDGLLQAGVGDFAMQTEKIEADRDLAYRIGYFTLGKPAPDRGKFIEVYRRQADGSWKCVGDIFNSNQE
jgi:ketosteroid isomerase-like protein